MSFLASPTTENNHENLLNRSLGVGTSILLVAGIMIGSGAFKKIAPMSQQLHNSTYIILAWITAGVISMLGAFTYAGLATVTSKTGGIFEYLRLSFGDFISFLFGWSFFTIIGSGAIAALAFIFSQSVYTIVSFPSPLDRYSDISILHIIYPFADSGIKLFAIIIVALLSWLNYRGVKPGALLNNIVTTAKISGIAILIFAGLFYKGMAPGDAPTIALSTASTGTSFFSSFMAAMLSALWAYDGWANITFISGEIRNPQRNLPYAILGGVSIAMLLYVLVNYSFLRVLSPAELAATTQSQIAGVRVAGIIMGKTGTLLISVLIMTCTFGAVNACIMVYARLYFRMADENRFFRSAAAVHPVFRTPHIALIWSGIWSAILIITGTFDLLTNLVVFASYFFFGLTAWGLIKLKRRKIITATVIGYPVTPFLVLFFSLALVINNFIVDPKQSAIGMLLVLSAVPFFWYFKRLEERKKQPLPRQV
jgi:APA family basic amino acid/polyamine antiporter